MLKRVIADDTIIIDGHDEAFPKSLSLQKKKSFYKLVLPFLMDMTRHVQSIQNR